MGDKYVALWNIFYGIAYNSKTVPFEITDWKDLLDPRLLGDVADRPKHGHPGAVLNWPAGHFCFEGSSVRAAMPCPRRT